MYHFNNPISTTYPISILSTQPCGFLSLDMLSSCLTKKNPSAGIYTPTLGKSIFQAFLLTYLSTLDINTTVSTWLELMALMSYYFARLWKHISSIFGTIGRREHIQRFLTILRNFGMREPINGILNTSLLEIKGRLYRLLHIINEFSHLRIHSFPLINIPS